MNALWDALAGTLTGVLSGWGVGGGTLLTVYMVMLRGIAQQTAQGINLLYFLPCAGGALTGHIKNKRIDWKAAKFCILGGLLTGVICAFLAQKTDAAWLRRLFGVLLLYVGFTELFHKRDS